MSDLEAWESKYGRIPDGAVVIMRSGFGKKYRNRSAYYGWPAGMEERDPTDTDNLHFPGFDPKAVEWLGEKRQFIVSLDLIKSLSFNKMKFSISC